MSRLEFVRSENKITYFANDGNTYPYECRWDFEEGYNEEGQPRESLPVGSYTANAEQPPTDYGPAYGTFYINTTDCRSRVIHGGGSSLPDPYAPRQGWLCTYGCLRMQNEDGEQLSNLMIADGNDVPFEVVE